MKATRLAQTLAAVAALTAFSLHAADWICSGSSLTEVVSGGTPWVLNVNVGDTNIAVTGVSTVGDSTTLDFSGAITDGGGTSFMIVELGGMNGRTTITGIVLPDGIKIIGWGAFQDCTALTTVTPFLPASLTEIRNQAFQGCTALSGDLVLSAPNLTAVGGGAFQRTGLSSATITSPLTTLWGGTFEQCPSLTSLVLPDTITTIDGWAADTCPLLRSVNIPASVTSIGTWAFRGSPLLSGDLVISAPNLTSIGNEAFAYAGYSSVTITSPITTLTGAFAACPNMTSLVLPDTVTEINEWAVNSCGTLGDVTLSASLASIGPYAFSSCSALTNVVFRGAAPTFGNGAFQGGPGNYRTRFCIPRFNASWENLMATDSNFTAMDASLEPTYRAFFPAGPLPNGAYAAPGETVWITDKPEDVASTLYVVGDPAPIGNASPAYGVVSGLADGASTVCTAPARAEYEGSFFVCVGSVLETEVSDRVFANAVRAAGNSRTVVQSGTEVKRLTWLWGPDGYSLDASPAGVAGGTVSFSPENTGAYASNTVVTLTATPSAGYRFAGWVGDIDGGFATNATVTVTMDGAKAVHPVFAGPWLFNGSNQITDGNWVLEVWQSGTELQVKSVVSVATPISLHLGTAVTDASENSYTIVSVNGFSNNTSLRCLFLPNTLRIIEWGAFSYCTSLERVEPFLPDSLTEIRNEAFKGCAALSGNLVLSAPNLTAVGGGAFQRTGLSSATITSPLTTLWGGTFELCPSLTSLVLPDTITTIDGWVADTCPLLRSVNIPASVTSIGKWAFRGSPLLSGDLIISAPNLTSIGDEAFAYAGYSTVTITSPITALTSAFAACPNMTSLVLPDTVTEINEWAVNSCGTLGDVTLSASLASIGSYAFSGCSALTNIWFKGTVPSTRAENAFVWLPSDNRVRCYVPANDTAWTVDFYGDYVTPMDDTLLETYRAIYPDGKKPKGRFNWSVNMWFCTWDPRSRRTIIVLQ